MHVAHSKFAYTKGASYYLNNANLMSIYFSICFVAKAHIHVFWLFNFGKLLRQKSSFPSRRCKSHKTATHWQFLINKCIFCSFVVRLSALDKRINNLTCRLPPFRMHARSAHIFRCHTGSSSAGARNFTTRLCILLSVIKFWQLLRILTR